MNLRYAVFQGQFVGVNTHGFYLQRERSYPSRLNPHPLYTLSQVTAFTNLLKRNYYLAISTTHNNTAFLRNRKSIIVCDCDGYDSLRTCLDFLRYELKCGYYVIESSIEHYWVIVDRLMFTKEALDTFNYIPGVDEVYKKYTGMRQDFFLRAVPKGKTLPKFSADLNSISTLIIRQWIESFRDYFRSLQFIECCDNLIINAISEEVIDNLEGLILMGEIKNAAATMQEVRSNSRTDRQLVW
jgi:hypothetical protein